MAPRTLLMTWLICSLPTAGLAQTVRVATEQETFRKAPDGTRLATLLRDTPMDLGARQGQWAEVGLEGWIWASSVEPTDREGHDLIVTAVGGENLRALPGQQIVARLLQGVLLDRIEATGQWVRVRRTGWVWGPSLAGMSAAGSEPPSEPPVEPPQTAEAPPPSDRYVTGPSPVGLRIAPGGDTLARLHPGTRVAVMERRDGWARVRLDGWIATSELALPDSVEIVTDLSAAALRANPDQYQGVRVRWTVQFISLERAERIRTDFFEGEPFVLARAPDPAEGFVYLAVPQTLMSVVQQLDGLEELEVLARVRTGRSALMGVPVLDLLAIY